MGVVWRGRAKTGAAVAIKTVRMAHARQLDGIRREIRALSRIRHPGIVRILDQGIQEGLPWYAMELLSGPSLRQRARLLTSSSTTRFLLSNFEAVSIGHTQSLDESLDKLDAVETDEALPQVRFRAANGKLTEMLSLALRLCRPLAFLHGQGIVHRDLKPENILVVDGRPVLVDFGLVSHGSAGREVLSVDSVLQGTLSYMAPEQIRVELVDARADIYALGCILYELVTGRLPFRSPSMGAALYQHLQRTPMAPSQRVDGVPEALDHLILTMLAKRPQDRPGYASDVAEVLCSLGAVPLDEPALVARSYLYRPRFSGRETTMRGLRSGVDRMRGTILLGGESGVGKTRLALEIAREAQQRGRVVLIGECQPADVESGQGHGGALYPLKRALLQIVDQCLQAGAHSTSQTIGQKGHVLGRYQPELLTLPGVREHPEPAPLDAEGEALRTMKWLTEVLVSSGDEGGAVLLLDDLQWADPMTLDWLRHLSRAEPEGLLVLGTYRLDDVPAGLKNVMDQPGLTLLSVRRMNREAVGDMASDMLAMPEVPPGLVAFLAEASDGNPFVIAEYLRVAVTHGHLVRKDFRWIATGPEHHDWSQLPLPHGLRELVLSRVDRLGASARAAIEAAAAAGREVQPQLIAALALPGGTADSDAWLDIVTETLDGYVLEEVDGRLRFVHDKVREVIYEQVLGPKRVALHGQLAAAMEDLGLTGDPGSIANHWQQAGAIAQARHWFLRAAALAIEQHAHLDAERMLKSALAHDTGIDEAGVRARVDLGHLVLRSLGRNSEALEALEIAREQARTLRNPGLLAHTLGALGECTGDFGRLSDALGLYRQAVAIVRTLDAPDLLARSLTRMARGLSVTGQTSLARAALAEARGIASRLDDTEMEARTLLGLSGLEGTPAHEAKALLDKALPRFREIGDSGSEASALNRRAMLLPDNEALAGYSEALAIWRAIGDRVHTGMALANIAIRKHDLGRSRESHIHYAEALQIFRETGHHRFQGHALHHIGQHLRREGRLVEAEGLNRQAFTLLSVVGDIPWSLRVRCELARIALRRQQPKRAFTEASKALQGASPLALLATAAEAARLGGIASEALGDLATARVQHQQARDAAERGDIGPHLAMAELHLCRLDRLDGQSSTDLLTRLEDVLPLLPPATRHPARTLAWVEHHLLSQALGTPSHESPMNARDAHHASLYLDPLSQQWLTELAPPS
jgi:serine/threonine protein kinase/tetratricopeptide (TPR) repeat protein